MTHLQNKFKALFIPESNEFISKNYPVLVGFLLIYLATIFVHNKNNFSWNSALLFTALLIFQFLLYFSSRLIFKDKHWLYFITQGLLILIYPIISPNSYSTILFGLVPVFIVQSMTVYTSVIKIISSEIIFYGVFIYISIHYGTIKELLNSIPLLLIITLAMRLYIIIFLKEVKLRVQAQKFSQELSLAYEKVEELTLINERQRMARDLHDTLSQGLAGIIMQLEAANANINKNNVPRAQEIIQKSMEHARSTLSDSRLVIDNLRIHAHKEVDFTKAINNEIVTFKNISKTSINANIKISSPIPYKISKHIVYIVRESLNNIAKHAEAKNAAIEVSETDDEVIIDIKDDGKGFDVKLLDQLFGHYGILGMTERVKAVDGKLKIKSKRNAGTNINITIPIVKGLEEENE